MIPGTEEAMTNAKLAQEAGATKPLQKHRPRKRLLVSWWSVSCGGANTSAPFKKSIIASFQGAQLMQSMLRAVSYNFKILISLMSLIRVLERAGQLMSVLGSALAIGAGGVELCTWRTCTHTTLDCCLWCNHGRWVGANSTCVVASKQLSLSERGKGCAPHAPLGSGLRTES